MQSKVQLPPFARAHRRKGKGLFRGSNLEYRLAGSQFQRHPTPLLESIHVEADPVVLLRLQPKHLGRQMLQREEKLGVTIQQPRGIHATELNQQFGNIPGRRRGHLVRETQTRVTENFGEKQIQFCCRLFDHEDARLTCDRQHNP